MAEFSKERVIVYDTPAVPDELWVWVRKMHVLQLTGALPAGQQHRISKITGRPDMQGLDDYIRSLVDPNVNVGHGLRPDQIFKGPLLSVVYDVSFFDSAARSLNSQPAAALTLADNTSGGKITRRIKMMAPQGRALAWLPERVDPSNKRHLRIGNAVAAPNSERLQVDSDLSVPVTTLLALLAVTKQRHDEQPMSTYVMPDDPADTMMTDFARAIGMTERWSEPNAADNGYLPGVEVVVMGSTVGDVNNRLRELEVTINPQDILRQTSRDV